MDRAVFDRMEAIDSEHWWFVARRAIVDRLIARFAPGRTGLQLLEIGCGTGSNLAMLGQFGAVEAIEPDDRAREIATARSGLVIRDGLLPDVPIADAHFDLILMLDVLEHVEADRATLAMLHSKLKPGGRLMLTVPAAPWMWSAHDVEHHHFRRYTAKALGQALTDAGFRIVHRSHYNTLLYPLIAVARLVGKITGKAGGDDAMPPRWINTMLTRIFRSEARWVPWLNSPVGVSLAVIAEPA